MVGGAWKPSLVILRINRAALHCRWSPDGKKFAVTSGAKCVPVCRFEADNNWWISKMIKQHRSTVLCVAWHPNSQLIATGSTDFKCRVFCTYLPIVDGAQDSGPAQFEEVDFGEKLAEFDCKGWIEAVAWSPSGNRLSYAGHNSTITVVSFPDDGEEEPAIQTIPMHCLPYRCLVFASEDVLVGAGHDFKPHIYSVTDAEEGTFEFTKSLDEKKKKKKAKEGDASTGDIMKQWQSKAKTGAAAGSSKLKSKHTNIITDMSPYALPGTICTTALDGVLVLWPTGL
jgi:actin related protein 2/3 complex subunit 1A/1B